MSPAIGRNRQLKQGQESARVTHQELGRTWATPRPPAPPWGFLGKRVQVWCQLFRAGALEAPYL